MRDFPHKTSLVSGGQVVLVDNRWWRSFWKLMVWLDGRVYMACLGYYVIDVRGTPAPRSECKILLGNHFAFVEGE